MTPTPPGSPTGAGGSGTSTWQPKTDDTWVRTGASPVETHGPLTVMGTGLVDSSGDPVQLKGVSSMWLNWEDNGFAENADAILWMRDHWNISVIRAAMGVEPSGAYMTNPDKAKAQVDRVVKGAVAAGVYVIIDFHDHNAHMHKDQAVAFFAEMSAKYKDLPNVIYEPFNEPEMLDWPTIKSYHESVVAAIRTNDPDNVIVLGTPNWSQYVDVAAASPVAGENLMYTLHFYSCTHTAWLRARAETALGKGIPLFITEWGATHSDGGTDGKVCLDEANTWLTWAASKGISWAAWKLDNCTPDSTCLLVPNAPVSGGWNSEFLRGHAPFVRDALRQ
jgi:aryl-phospho-beta-D-glucosidase BglC (GH1 family)